MEVTREMVEKIANLAKLSFEEQELEDIRRDLEQMIGFVDQLKALDLEGVLPRTHMSDTVNVWREDQALTPASRASALENAPTAADPYFTAPMAYQKQS